MTPTPVPALGDAALDRYLDRVGLVGTRPSLTELQAAHVDAIPYEDLDVHLGRSISLELDHLVGKIVHQGRGGYCYEQNTLFAAVLEALGHPLTRHLGRVRLGDATTPRAATHMVLVVDGLLVDVGFGGATPIGPVPLGGAATYRGWTWTTERTLTPEGERGWLVRLGDDPLYTFTDEPRHPVDYLAPNHYSSTHPLSLFTQHVIAQRWAGDTQVSLVDGTLSVRRSDGAVTDRLVDGGDLRDVLHQRFGIALAVDDVARLAAAGDTARGRVAAANGG